MSIHYLHTKGKYCTQWFTMA